jgi:hypothetical protein
LGSSKSLSADTFDPEGTITSAGAGGGAVSVFFASITTGGGGCCDVDIPLFFELDLKRNDIVIVARQYPKAMPPMGS